MATAASVSPGGTRNTPKPSWGMVTPLFSSIVGTPVMPGETTRGRDPSGCDEIRAIGVVQAEGDEVYGVLTGRGGTAGRWERFTVESITAALLA